MVLAAAMSWWLRGFGVRISNWGMFLLAVYLILVGLEQSGFFLFLGFRGLTGIIALIAGILLLMENWRR